MCKDEESDTYLIVDGTRRWTVLTEFGWKSAPCIVLESMAMGEIAHFAFEKNMKRKSLSPIEVALHIKSMRDKYGYSLRELEALGYGSKGLISQNINLLELPALVKRKIEGGKLTASHGYVLEKLDNAKQQERMAKQALDFGWTVKRLKTAIKSLQEKGKNRPRNGFKFPKATSLVSTSRMPRT